MDAKLLDEVIACFPEERTTFCYFKDQYAVYLLKQYLASAISNEIHQIKQSKLKRLLDKPLLKETIKSSGNGRLELAQLESVWPAQIEHYVLTLGRWGHKRRYDWNQTSRPGANLVLQLNLNHQFEAMFRAVAGCHLNKLTSAAHPKSGRRNATLSWARLDMDFETGEILIEEIQSDLIRDLEYTLKRALCARGVNDMRIYWSRQRLDRKKVAAYCEYVIAEQKKIWAEAMMAATLWFVQQELGFRKIYYHSFDTGKVMKKIKGSAPPHSLYTDLPEKFCFETTTLAPTFIAKNSRAKRRLKAAVNPQWYVLAS